MSETIDIEKSRSPNPAWLAIPLVLFALMSLTVGLIARGAIRQPYPTPFFHLFFSDTLDMKVWLITAAVVLGFFQLLTAARIYQLLRFSPPGRLYNLVHRFSGYTAVALTVPVAYHCIFLLGFGTYDLRVYIHSTSAQLCMAYSSPRCCWCVRGASRAGRYQSPAACCSPHCWGCG